MFAGLCELTEFFRERLAIFIALAPVARVDNMTAGILHKINSNQKLVDSLEKLEIHEMMPGKENNHKFQAFLNKMFPGGGNLVVSMTADEDTAAIDKKGMQNFVLHFPAGTSRKSVMHFRQETITRRFQKYDYGAIENTKLYG